jgi:uncharacterized membrane protein
MENSTLRPGGLKTENRRDVVFVLVSALLTVLFFFLPTGFEGASQSADSLRARGKIVKVNNERLRSIGPVKHGEQQLEVEIRSGPFKGELFSGSNNLMGKIELDKVFAPGDSALVILSVSEDGAVRHAQVYDHYRTDKTIFLCVVFFVFIVFIMGWMGVKIVITFVFTAAALIRILFPAMLLGWDPIFASALITGLLRGGPHPGGALRPGPGGAAYGIRRGNHPGGHAWSNKEDLPRSRISRRSKRRKGERAQK